MLGLVWCFKLIGLQYRTRLSITRAGHPAKLGEDVMKASRRREQRFSNWLVQRSVVDQSETETAVEAAKPVSAAKQRRTARLNHERACAHKSKGTPSTAPRNGMSYGEVDVFACSETLLQRSAA
jgi:hypothetical protein